MMKETPYLKPQLNDILTLGDALLDLHPDSPTNLPDGPTASDENKDDDPNVPVEAKDYDAPTAWD